MDECKPLPAGKMAAAAAGAVVGRCSLTCIFFLRSLSPKALHMAG